MQYQSVYRQGCKLQMLRYSPLHRKSKKENLQDEWQQSCKAHEGDFSLFNWHREPNAMAMMDFSLEAIQHCKQRISCLGALTAMLAA